ncbi:MAG: aminomethyltransferase, partial [Kiritimatiellia bacterium]
QGPNARKILTPLVEWDMHVMRFFRVQKTTLAGLPVWVSRTGYTGDLGYEIWTHNEHALAVWDAIMAEGKRWNIEPIGLDALDVVRIEAGYVLQGIDYISAKSCLIESRKSSPQEAGLGWTVDLDRDEDSDAPAFIGQRALLQERSQGSKWAMVGLELDWQATETLYEEYGLPPHLAPEACRDAVPIYDASGKKQVGQVTSTTWSPLLKRYIALGQVLAEYGTIGTQLRVEHTVEVNRRQLPATVVNKPFFDPERKKHTPKKFKRNRKAS